MPFNTFRSRLRAPMTLLAFAGAAACGRVDVEAIVNTVKDNATKQPDPAMPPAPMASGCVAPGEVPLRPLQLPAAQIAERLAAALWGGAADEGLVAAVADARTNHDLAPIARKMIADPRGSKRVGALIARWLHLPTAPLATDAASTAAAAVVRGDASLTSLLAGAVLATDPAAVALAAEGDRRGITMHPGVLSAHSRATARGVVVRDALLCQAIPPPPPAIPPVPPSSSGQTYRQRLELATSEPACSACHKLTDPPGFAYEAFDELGRARTTDNGQPVDTSAEIRGLDGPSLGVANAAELVSALAERCEVQTCVANRWLALAADDDQPDAADVVGVASAFSAAKLDLRELLVAIAQSDAVLAR